MDAAAPNDNGAGGSPPYIGPNHARNRARKERQKANKAKSLRNAAARRAALSESFHSSYQLGVALAAFHQSQMARGGWGAARAGGGARGRGSGRGGGGAGGGARGGRGGRGGGGGGRGGGLGAVGGGGPDSSNPGADLGPPDAPGPQAEDDVVENNIEEAPGREPTAQ